MNPILIAALLLTVTSVQAQTTPTWFTYTVKDEKFSVAFPALPACEYRKVLDQRYGKERIEVAIGAYADGVVYTVFIIESSARSFDEFIGRRTRSGRVWNLSTERKVTVDGVERRVFNTIDSASGETHFFANGNRLFQFAAVGAAPDDARITQFFSSIWLTQKEGSIDLTKPLPDLQVSVSPMSTTTSEGNENTSTGGKADRKVYVAFKPEPRYTEDARQNRIVGTVILKCVFSANGTITRISVVQGLPLGLTERAIAAARMIKFIPAMKEGRFVSVFIQLEYNFNLY
jgi:TonB family protein